MRQTLLYLPESILGIPLFGVGWALGLLLLLGGLVWLRSAQNLGFKVASLRWAPTLLIAMLVVVVVLPKVEGMRPITPEDALPGHGVPIRGYGVMLVVAAVTSVGLAARRAAQAGIAPERIYDLAVPFFVGGLIGARAMFMTQYWQAGQYATLSEFLAGFFNIAEGGLVVYGSLIGAAVAFLWYNWRHRLPQLVMADVIAPCLLLGLAVGRIGCFLNGCCWGGLCDDPWSVRFPKDSPPYVTQMRSGALWGLRWAWDDQPGIVVDRVYSGSPAERAGLKPGSRIVAINATSMKSLGGSSEEAAERIGNLFQRENDLLNLELGDGRGVTLRQEHALDRSLPVHPTQLYSSIDALVLLGLLLAYEPFRRKPGELVALTFTVHPISRFLLEVIRDDVGGAWQTGLTPSQLLSIAILLAALGLWLYLRGWVGKAPTGTKLRQTV